MQAVVYGGPKWTVSPVYEGMLKEEMDAAADRHPGVDYRPTLIDAACAGLLREAAEVPRCCSGSPSPKPGGSLGEQPDRFFN